MRRHPVVARGNDWMDLIGCSSQKWGMGRYKYHAYVNDTSPRYIVVWDLQWQLIEVTRLDAKADLRAAMSAAAGRLATDGWLAEGHDVFGFVFMRRAGERRLLMLTPRDPHDTRVQSFNPFKC